MGFESLALSSHLASLRMLSKAVTTLPVGDVRLRLQEQSTGTDTGGIGRSGDRASRYPSLPVTAPEPLRL